MTRPTLDESRDDLQDDVAFQVLKIDTLKNKVVILPFYGEFGIFILSHIRYVEYVVAEEKVVCCRQGEEAFFPSADEFFYDWQDIFDDNMKCGVRNDWPATSNYELTDAERSLNQTLRLLYPDYELLSLDQTLPLQSISTLSISLNPKVHYDAKVDIIVGARKRHSIHPLGDRGMRNFEAWNMIVDPLVKKGYSIGQIGQRETTFYLPDTITCSWNFPRPVDAMISMLCNCQLYIGTDTGLTHLAVLLGTPTICFRCNDGSLDLLSSVDLHVAKGNNSYFNLVQNGWANPESVLETVSNYLLHAVKDSS